MHPFAMLCALRLALVLLILSPTASQHGRICRLDEISRGKWVKDTNITRKAFVCCNWEEQPWRRPELHEACGAEPPHAQMTNVQVGRTDHNVMSGGNACHCDEAQKTRFTISQHEQYTWHADDCDVMAWNATQFCALLGDRRMLFLGDSTMIQTAATVMNMIVSDVPKGLCGPQLMVLKHYSEPFTDISERLLAFSPDIVIVNFGPHYALEADFLTAMKAFIYFVSQIRAALSPKMVEFVWKTTNLPHSSCKQFSAPTLAYAPTPPEHDPYNWSRLPGYDLLAHAMLLEQGFKFMNMHMVDLRGDAHCGSLGIAPYDCLHYCTPGPLNIAANWLLHYLHHHHGHKHHP